MSRALDVLTAIWVSLSFASSICSEPRLLNLSSGANPSTHTLCAAIVQCFFHVHCECTKVLCSALFTPYRLPAHQADRPDGNKIRNSKSNDHVRVFFTPQGRRNAPL